jgi:hypothetical protein
LNSSCLSCYDNDLICLGNASAGNLSVIPFFKALDGHGPKAADLGSVWHGGGLYHNGMKYHVGPSPSHIILTLNNRMNFSTKDVSQTIGILRGSMRMRSLFLGITAIPGVPGPATLPVALQR